MKTSLLISCIALMLSSVYIIELSVEVRSLKIHNAYLTDTYMDTLKAILVENDMSKAIVLMHQLDDYYQKYPEIDHRKKEVK